MTTETTLRRALELICDGDFEDCLARTLIYFFKGFVVLTGVILSCMIVAYFLKLYGVIL